MNKNERQYTYVKKWRNEVLVREFTKGKRYLYIDKGFEPYAFLETDKKNTGWRTIEEKACEKIGFSSIKSLRDFIQRCRGIKNVYLPPTLENQYVSEKFGTGYDITNLGIWTLDIETKAEYGFPNIETANEDIILITVRNRITEETITWGYKEYTGEQNINYILCDDEEDLLRKFISWWTKEKPDILTGWNVEFFDMPYLIHRIHSLFGTGDLRNPENEYFIPINGFMVNKLSPFGVIRRKKYKEDDKLRGGEFSYEIFGVSTLDYMKLYKKYIPRKKEAYNLDYIAKVELNEQKVPNKYPSFSDFYTKDWNSFVEYNIQDVVLVDRLETKLGFISVHCAFAYMGGVNFEDAFFQTKIWDGFIHKYFEEDGLVVPIKEEYEKEEKFKGAYVKKTLTGFHRWIVSFDLRSVYPMSLIQFNISPETALNEKVDCTMDSLVNKTFDTSEIHKRDVCLAGNGYLYRKDKKGFMGIIVDKLFNERNKHKKLMQEAENNMNKYPDNPEYERIYKSEKVHQEALKISLVSAYGTVGSPYFRFYDQRIAESVTQSTQYIIRTCEKRINEFFNETLGTVGKDYIIAMDTDSLYLDMEKLIEKYIPNGTLEEKVAYLDDKCERVLHPLFESIMKEIAEYTNSIEPRMVMKRESIAEAGMWTAKKKYFLRVLKYETVEHPNGKVLYKGIEIVRSDTPAIVRDLLLDSLDVILDQDEKRYNEMMAKFQMDFETQIPETVAIPTSIKNFIQYCTVTSGPEEGKVVYDPKGNMVVVNKPVTMHARATINYNNLITRMGLEHKYPLIKAGDRIKYVFLKQPNDTGVDVIAFHSNSVLPPEFNVHKRIDYKRHFKRSFVSAMTRIIGDLPWRIQQTHSLSG